MANNVILEALQTASFRGIAFKFIAHQETGGRKSVTYEYPNQNERFVQDLGKMPRIFNMDCYVNSQDLNYFNQTNSFRDALSTKGAGILIHPYEGAVNVFAKPYSLTESIEELGYAVFRVQFQETASAIFPNQNKIFAAIVSGQLTSFIENMNSNFVGNL